MIKSASFDAIAMPPGPAASPSPRGPAFPIACLPEPFRHYAVEGAAAVGVPVDMVALPLLVAAGATIGRRRCLRPKPGWDQLPVLFGAVVASPGSAKSPALFTALRPLHHLQHVAFEQHRRILRQTGSPGGTGKLESPAPPLDHFYSTDATMEAIAPMLVTSPGLLVYHDELLGWVRSCDAYRGGKGADRQHWLSSWSCAAIKVDRKGSPPIYVARPAVSVLGGIQPDMLRHLHDPHGGRDGFVERILWTFPETQPTPWTTATIGEATSDEVIRLFAALRRAVVPGTQVIELKPAARSTWIQWYNDNQLQVLRLEGLAAGFAAKLPVQVARLGLILHAMGDPNGRQAQLDERTMMGAIELGEYFRSQFEKVLPLIGGAPAKPPRSVKEPLSRALEEATRLSRTQLYQEMNGNVSARELDDVLAELAAEGRVVKEEVRDTGGRPAEHWRWLTKSQPTTRDAGSTFREAAIF